MTVWKYTIELAGVSDQPVTITMPRWSQVLSVQAQHGDIALWALVDPDPTAETEERRFLVVGTGQPIPDAINTFWGTVQFLDGALVLHVFEVTKP